MKKTYHIAVWIIALNLFGCGGGGGGGGGETGGTADTTAPAFLSQTPAGRPLKTDTTISIRFDESIDTTSFTLTGSLAEESDGGVWSQTDAIDDTLTITPKTSWSVDTGRSLVVNVKDLAGNPMAELTLGHDVYSGTLYYVSSAATDDTGDGLTAATAKQTIMAAITDAAPPATVVVNAGDYPVSYSPDTRVWLVEGVSLYGGYSADFTARTLGSSVITDQSTLVADQNNPNFAVLGNEGITSATLVDGFTLQGTSQTGPEYTSAIRMRLGAAPVVQNNTIHGGSGDVATYGMYNDSSSPLVQYNTIHGGNSSNTSGMWNRHSTPLVQHNTIHGGNGNNSSSGMLNTASSPLVHHNTIHGGNGNYSYGMRNNGSSPLVQNNTIDGGSGDSSSFGISNSFASPLVQDNTIDGGSGSRSFGIVNSLSSPTVQSNTINGGSGDFTYAMYNTSANFSRSFSTPTVMSNILLTRTGAGSFCIFEFDEPSDPTYLHFNNFVACEVLYHDEGSADLIHIDEVNALIDISGGAYGNTYSETLSQ